MKKILIFILALILIGVLLAGIIKHNNLVNENKDKIGENIENNSPPQIPNLPGDSSAGSSGSSGSSSGSSSSSSQSENLPDFENQECGFYFSSYEVCAGTCPAGDCIQEGRSCYCRI